MRLLLRSALLVFALTASAQTPQPDPQLQHRPPNQHPADITVTKQMVVLNITIHDKEGKPVHGLTAADFSVLDENQPQTVSFVEEHAATQPEQVVALPKLPPGIYSNIPNAPVNDALNVILLDAQDTSVREQSRLFHDIQKLASTLPPGARTAIVKLGTHLEIVCGFTADHDRLNACLNNDAAWPSVPIPTSYLFGQTDALAGLSEYLSQFPGRKNILWFSHYFPGANPSRSSDIPVDVGDSLQENALEDIIVGANSTKPSHIDVNDIALYPVDPVGVTAPAAFNASGGMGGLNAMNHIASRNDALRTTQMDVIAHETGGKPLYGNNDLAAQAVRAIQDGSSYYTIAWSPKNLHIGAFHHVDISLSHHSGAKLNYRPGYRALPESTTASYAQNHPLPASLQHGSPDADGLLFRVRVQPAPVQPDLTNASARVGQFAAQLKQPLRYVIDWAVDPRRLVTQAPPADQPEPGTAFTVVAYDADGKLLNYVADATSNVNAPPVEKGGLQFHQFIDLPKGNLYLRLQAVGSDGRTGSTEIAIKAEPPATPAAAAAPAQTTPSR